jgi:excisionase family DNA binding protein
VAGQPDLPAGSLSGHGRSGRQARAAVRRPGLSPSRSSTLAPHCQRPCRARDAGLTPRPEQSGGGAGRTYRHRQRTRTARDTGPATPADEPAPAPDALLTIEEVIAELRVSRAAFYRWRRRGTGPAEVRLPGGGVRIRRSALGAWLCRLEQPQQEDTPA